MAGGSESPWKEYMRTNIAEMRPVTDWDIEAGLPIHVSVSQADRENGSPKKGDMVARNPNNHDDQWLVAKEYFENNFKKLK